MSEKPRILLLLPTRTYRATDFLAAGTKLDVEVVVASEEASTTADQSPRDSLVLDFSTPDVATPGDHRIRRNTPYYCNRRR